MALLLWLHLFGLRFKFVSKPDIALFIEQFISQIKVKRSDYILVHFGQRTDKIQKKTAEVEAADNSSNAYHKNDTGA